MSTFNITPPCTLIKEEREKERRKKKREKKI